MRDRQGQAGISGIPCLSRRGVYHGDKGELIEDPLNEV